MATTHTIHFSDAARMAGIDDESVHLLVTSPPYPMIQMWDQMFFAQNPEIRTALEGGAPERAFELMHCLLDRVWQEAYRVLAPGAVMCINIGDATRSIDGNFRLFSSHSRILSACLALGFQNLPNILWRKTTNAPNKFMGSGMLPVGAYVTLEHEYVLIFRKGTKRRFTDKSEKLNRQESAFFWEERNNWFSDVWMNLIGVRQDLDHGDVRARSAAFPFEFAYRLINMFSVRSDTVLDPFLGTGTTMLAAMASERHSIGFELDPTFGTLIAADVRRLVPFANEYIHERLAGHVAFVKERQADRKPPKNRNVHYGFPCVSRQEERLLIRNLAGIEEQAEGRFVVEYVPEVQQEFCGVQDLSHSKSR